MISEGFQEFDKNNRGNSNVLRFYGELLEVWRLLFGQWLSSCNRWGLAG